MGTFNSHYVHVPKFAIDDVSGVTFGGFLADKYICSQPNSRPDEGSPDVVKHTSSMWALAKVA